MLYDVGIIGGGIIGLATAWQFLQHNPKATLVLLEKENAFATHQTGHNSGVIHSGIYYKPGSLKAEQCKQGYQSLLEFCQKNDIPFELCGKIIVATTPAEKNILEQLWQRGLQNKLKKLKRLSKEEIKEQEPYVDGLAAIQVPQTGIIDYKKVAQKYAELIQKMGGMIMVNAKVIKISDRHSFHVLTTSRGDDITAKIVVNCCGLHSDNVTEMTEKRFSFRIIPFRGEYYQLKKEKENYVKNLIYPVPNPDFPFLGVHFTRMIGGGIEAGPNAVFAFKKEGYKKNDVNFNELMRSLLWPGFQKIVYKYWKEGLREFYRSYSQKAFTRSLQRLIPTINEEDIVPIESGVRAQACDKNGNLIDDFVIIEKKNLIHVCNTPSPAATASLAIGAYIANKINQQLK